MSKKAQEHSFISKRYSKISNALKSYFFTLVYRKEMTIKDSAKICRLNYSTAKAIIRDLTAKQKNYIQTEISNSKLAKKFNLHETYERSEYRQTSYSQIDSSSSNEIENQTAKYEGLTIPKPTKKITVISTIGHDFLNPSNISDRNY